MVFYFIKTDTLPIIFNNFECMFKANLFLTNKSNSDQV